MQRERAEIDVADPRRDTPAVAPFDDEPDMTLVDELLRMTMSDRLRTLTRYANALRRFRRV